MFDEAPLPLAAPVYVTHQQAVAYAAWAGARLPTEAEWQRAAYGRGERHYPWGDEAPDAARANLDFMAWDPLPVTAHPARRHAGRRRADDGQRLGMDRHAVRGL